MLPRSIRKKNIIFWKRKKLDTFDFFSILKKIIDFHFHTIFNENFGMKNQLFSSKKKIIGNCMKRKIDFFSKSKIYVFQMCPTFFVFKKLWGFFVYDELDFRSSVSWRNETFFFLHFFLDASSSFSGLSNYAHSNRIIFFHQSIKKIFNFFWKFLGKYSDFESFSRKFENFWKMAKIPSVFQTKW